MSSREELWAMDQPVPPAEKLVLYGLAQHSGGGGEFGRSTTVDMTYLCRLTTYDEPTVRGILNRLYRLGYIVVETEPYQNVRPEYRLLETPGVFS